VKNYFSNIVFSSFENPRRLCQTVNKLLRRKCASPFPSSTSSLSLDDSLASFYIDKIDKLRLSLAAISSSRVSSHTFSASYTSSVLYL